MSSWNPEYEISVSDFEEDGDYSLKNIKGRECIIFIVDASLYSNDGLLENALLIIRNAFLSGILLNDKDLIGLIFTNTKYSPEPCDKNFLENIILPEKCAIFLRPCQLSTSIVKHFLKFVETAPVDFGKIYGVITDGFGCNFSHVLRLCMDLVQQCNYLVDNTTIVFLTDNELPHPYNSDCYKQLLQKAADLKDKDVEFQLVPMIDDFNYDIFYKEFICLIKDIDIECFEASHPRRIREMLSNRKFKQHYVRRSLGHIKFSLNLNLVISVQYFSYYQKQKKPVKLLLQRTDSAIVQKHRITQVRKHEVGFETYNEIKDINIKNAWYEINLGSNNMRISYEQVNKIRNIHSPEMVLLGFKPISYLKGTLFSKSANFMYPDDSHIEGSKRLFRALWEKCIEKQKIAICLFLCKRKSMPRYVALIPIDDVGTYNYNGFKILYLSCYSYIRSFNLNNWISVENEADDREIIVCEKLMKKFRLDYKADILCDPYSDQLHSKLLSLAFNVNYETLSSQYFPNPEQQNLRINTILTSFQQIFGDINDTRKRCLDNKSLTNSIKKIKMDSLDIHNKDCVMKMIEHKNLNSCSKDQLVQILKNHFKKNVPKNQTKKNLVDLIYSL